jgi:cytochrome c oxidase subunit 2
LEFDRTLSRWTAVIEQLLPVAASEHAAGFDGVLAAVHVHMGIQAAAWGAFFLYCIVRFRHRARPRAAQSVFPQTLALLAIGGVIVGDAVLLATSALPVWLRHASVPSSLTDPLEIRVIAEQFAWNVHYPGPDGRFGLTRDALISATNPVGIDRTSEAGRDDIGLLNILTVPVDRPVIVRLSSRDVVHSFTLNEMRIRQDATPGLVVRTWFTPIKVGRWEIGCSQLCGLGHSRMRGAFTVVTAEEWRQWQEREVALITPR